jgi:hypothetical protein
MPSSRVGRLVLLALMWMVLVSGCSLVPNMDAGSAGCSNARGIGAPGADAAVGDLVGLSPAQAATIAAGRGHTVVFNVQIEGFGECWCAPPPEGKVTEGFFTGRGALMLMIDGVDVGHTADQQPFMGWGC